MKKRIIVSTLASLAAVLMIFTSCAPQDKANDVSEDSDTSEQEKVEIINDTPEEFEAAMEGEYLLLDVRTQGEYDAGHIYDPTLIPVDELGSRISEIEDYKDKPVLVYCRSGNRSTTASNILISNGFTQVHNLLGGIGAWNAYKGE